ncbi:MAG: cyclic nucleotide-binding domain-containing protein [Acidimicrobiales bacterium]
MSKSNNAKETRLRSLPMFAGADKHAVAHLAGAADEADLDAGHALIEEGHLNNDVYVVESGTAEVTVGGTVVAEIGPGDMVGELGYFAGQPATATVRSTSPMEVLILPYNRFDQILDDNPGLVRAIASTLAARLAATDARLS